MAALDPNTVMFGNPPTTAHQPSAVEMARLLLSIQSQAAAGGISYIDGTLSELQSRNGVTDGQFGLVLSDGTEGGVYERANGAWSKNASIPAIFIESLAAESASASEVAAALSEANAAESADQAALALNGAQAAAELVGPYVVYDTYSSASAALSGLPEGQLVRVLLDENYGETQQTYRVESSALVRKPVRRAPAVFYVSNGGSDSAAGLSPEHPLQTISAASAAAQAGDVVCLERGGVWRESPTFAAGVTVRTYGSGLKPIISAQDVVSTFTVANTGAPAYKFTVTLPEGTAARSYPGVWEDGRRLREYRIGKDGLATNADVRAAVKANAGSFGFLSWTTDPLSDSSGGWAAGSCEYIIHASDGSNPNSNGKIYETPVRARPVNGGAEFHEIRLHLGYHHDGVYVPMVGGSIERLARHGNLPAVPTFKGVTVIGDNPAYTGGGFFHSNPTSLADDAVYDGCIVVGEGLNGIAFYQHGAVSGDHVRLQTYVRDSAAYNVATCLGFDEVEQVFVDNFRARNFGTLLKVSSSGTALLRGIDAKGGSGGTGTEARLLGSSPSSSSVTIRDSDIEYRSVSMFFTSSVLGSIEVYDTNLVHVTDFIAGNDNSIAWSTGSISRLWLERCRVIAPNEAEPYLIRATSAPDVRIRDCLFVGVSTDSEINGTTTAVEALDSGARAVSISREKAIAKYNEDGVELKYGVYEPGDNIFADVTYPGSSRQPRRYVAVGDVIAASMNGVSRPSGWTVIDTPSSFLNSVTFSNGGDGTCFVAVGNDGLIMRSNSVGESWSVVGTGVTSENLNAVWSMDAAGTMVAVGDNGTVLRSTDAGQTWAAATTSDTTRDLYGVASNRAGTQWVACGEDGRVITSTDGDTWSEQTLGSRTFRCAYHFNDATFMIGGDTGTLYTSANGTLFTLRTTNTYNSITAFGWNGGGSVTAVARQQYLYADTVLETSDSGATWTVSDQTFPFEVTGITGPLHPMESYGSGNDEPYSQGRTVVVGDSQAIAIHMEGSWGVSRLLESSTTDTGETYERWLSRVV